MSWPRPPRRRPSAKPRSCRRRRARRHGRKRGRAGDPQRGRHDALCQRARVADPCSGLSGEGARRVGGRRHGGGGARRDAGDASGFRAGGAGGQCGGRGRGRQARHRDAVVAELRSRLLPASSLAPEEKIIFDWSVLDERLQEWRRQGLRIGFTNGCFDLLHPRPRQADGRGARRLRPAGGRGSTPMPRCGASRATGARCRTCIRAPRCWRRSKRSISSSSSSRTRRSS